MANDALQDCVGRAFKDTVEAGQLIYAGGMSREIKDEYIKAHSALLKLKSMLVRRTVRVDKYGNRWPDAPDSEFCSECGQPDNCGDCNHQPLSPDDVEELGGEPRAPATAASA